VIIKPITKNSGNNLQKNKKTSLFDRLWQVG